MKHSVLEQIFEISAPWFIEKVETDTDKTIDVFISYQKGSEFNCSECNTSCKVHDSSYRRWRHLDIVDYQCYLNVKVPRTKCLEDGVKTIKELPWMRMNTHYSYKLEFYMMQCISEMSVTSLSKLLGEPDNNIWRTFNHYIENWVESQIDLSGLRRVCVDEKSSKKGHNYVTIFSDYDTGNVIFVTEGRDKMVFDKFKDWLYEKAGNPKILAFISMDMSKSYQAGALQFFPRSEIVFDRFHIKMGMNKALNHVRATEVKEKETLKKTKYLWLSNQNNLSEDNQNRLKDILLNTSLDTVNAYQLKCQFDELWHVPDIGVYPAIYAWLELAYENNIKQVNTFASTVINNIRGIANSMMSKISNGVAEAINSVVQLTKARARGFRNIKNFMNMIYMLGNDFQFST